MGYYFFRPRLPIRLNRAFLAILVIDICSELFECIAFRLNETWPFQAPVLLWIFNLLFFVFGFIFLTRKYPYQIINFGIPSMLNYLKLLLIIKK